MLIGNYSVFNKCPGKWRAGTSTCDRSAYNLPGMSRGFYYADGGVTSTDSAVLVATHPLFTYGIPLGEVPPYSWIIPQIAGGMAMRTYGSSSISFTLIPQQPTSASFTGSGTLTADASLLISMLCAMTGSGTITASITGNGNATASITGSGNLAADITAFGNMISSLTGSGLLSADITAKADMSIDITVTGSGLTTANVGNAIWGALAAEFNNPDTMGAIMNSIGSGTDPWATVLPGPYTGDEAGALLLATLKKIKALAAANL
ncbi:conserved hypothetical protein [Gammaproteobacteria bacterium]